MNNEIEKIKKSFIFSSLAEEELRDISNEFTFKAVKYKKGEIVAQEDEACNSLGLLLEGVLEVLRIYSSGKQVLINKLKGGNTFGEAIIFSNDNKYPATVIASENCEVLYITKEELENLFLKNNKILEGFLKLLSNKILMLNSKIKNISFKNVRQRVINFILERQAKTGGTLIKLEDSKEKIAELLGIPRPSLSRELIALRDLGYIDFDRNNITIIDIQGLESEMFN